VGLQCCVHRGPEADGDGLGLNAALIRGPLAEFANLHPGPPDAARRRHGPGTTHRRRPPSNRPSPFWPVTERQSERHPKLLSGHAALADGIRKGSGVPGR
jgi:hypothetical protein